MLRQHVEKSSINRDKLLIFQQVAYFMGRASSA